MFEWTGTRGGGRECRGWSGQHASLLACLNATWEFVMLAAGNSTFSPSCRSPSSELSLPSSSCWKLLRVLQHRDNYQSQVIQTYVVCGSDYTHSGPPLRVQCQLNRALAQDGRAMIIRGSRTVFNVYQPLLSAEGEISRTRACCCRRTKAGVSQGREGCAALEAGQK